MILRMMIGLLLGMFWLPPSLTNSPSPGLCSGDQALTCRTAQATIYLPLVKAHLGTQAFSIAATSTHLYVGTEAALQIFDLRESLRPTYQTSIPVAAPILDIVISEQHLYFTTASATTANLTIMGLQDPAQPQLLGTYTVLRDPHRLAVQNKIAYIADFYAGFIIIDAHNPRDPQLLYHDTTIRSPRDVELVGTRLYVSSGNLTIFDVQQPATPQRVASYESLGFISSVKVVGTSIYLAEYFGRSEILMMQSSGNLVVQSVYDTMWYPGFHEVVGTRIYMSGSYSRYGDCSGLEIFDAQDLTKVTRINILGGPTILCPRAMLIVDTTAYIADQSLGLVVLDLTKGV